MHKSATGGAQMSRVSVDVQNTSTRYFPVSSCQERYCSIRESEAIESVEQPWL
jgi:hypothetical protein